MSSTAAFPCLIAQQPFVDEDHPLHGLFPPRVWAIRIPVILILLGSAVVGSFLSLVMIRSNRKKAQKAKLGKS
jgi:dolichyl-phosphate mannosyltransferase polypeptide 2 regulatory subunit